MTQKDLVTRIYFDVISNGVCAKINHCYGETVVNPLDSKAESTDDYYMRNYEQEEQVWDFLKSVGMYENKGLMILDDDEKLVDLLNGRIEELKTLAEVYYSEEFKKIQIRSVKKMQMGVRLNTESNLLEFDFNIEDFDDTELHNLFHSIKQKKNITA